MANKSSDYLYQLIKSLTKAEKRYFKLFVNRHTSSNSVNNYEKLFDVIDKQKVFNEQQLIEKLEGNLFLNKFSIAKARLYDTILKSLDAFYSEKSTTQIIRNEIHYIEILYNKSLYTQCGRRINSAKKLAKKHDKKLLLKEIIDWQKKLIEKYNYYNLSISDLNELIKDEKQLLEQVSLETNLWEIKSKLFQHINTKGKARSLQEVDELKGLIYDKITKIEVSEKEVRLRYLYLHTKSAFYFATYEYEKCFSSIKETLSLIEINPIEFKDEPNILFSELNNMVYLAMRIGKVKEAQKYYSDLKALFGSISAEASDDLILKLKSSIVSLELTLIRMSCNLNTTQNVLDGAIDFIDQYKSKLNDNRLAYLYYNIAVVYFLKENYSEALKWINVLLNDINIDKTQEIYSFAQIFNLVVHLELENKELILYTIKSTKRFLQTRNKIFKFESVMLNFVRKISLKSNVFDIAESYQELKDELDEVQKNKYEQIPFEYFDYNSWVESKLTKKSMLKVAKIKAVEFQF